MEISVKEIIDALRLVEKKLLQENQASVKIEDDNYWVIRTYEWADFSRDPEPSVGFLGDDIKRVQDAVERKMIACYSEVDSLATLLRALSEKFASGK